jgi:hypothetical protein
MDEIEKNETPESENRAISATEENATESESTPTRFSPFCRTGCVICNSGILQEIHTLRPTCTFIELSETIKKEYGLEFSKDQLWRHFQNFNQKLSGEIFRHIANFDLQVETLSEHQKRVLFLGKIAYEDILRRVDAGTIQFSIDDFEKIMKLFYGTMQDPSAAITNSNQIINLFVAAANRGGAPLEQQALPIPRTEPTTEQRRLV